MDVNNEQLTQSCIIESSANFVTSSVKGSVDLMSSVLFGPKEEEIPSNQSIEDSSQVLLSSVDFFKKNTYRPISPEDFPRSSQIRYPGLSTLDWAISFVYDANSENRKNDQLPPLSFSMICGEYGTFNQ